MALRGIKDPDGGKDWAKDDEAESAGKKGKKMAAKSKPAKKEPTPGAVKSTVSADERDWRVDSALRDFEQVERHKQDPMLMKDVERLRSQKIDHLASIKVETAPKTMKKRK